MRMLSWKHTVVLLAVVVVMISASVPFSPEIETTEFAMVFGPGFKPSFESTPPLVLCVEGEPCDVGGVDG